MPCRLVQYVFNPPPLFPLPLARRPPCSSSCQKRAAIFSYETCGSRGAALSARGCRRGRRGSFARSSQGAAGRAGGMPSIATTREAGGRRDDGPVLARRRPDRNLVDVIVGAGEPGRATAVNGAGGTGGEVPIIHCGAVDDDADRWRGGPRLLFARRGVPLPHPKSSVPPGLG